MRSSSTYTDSLPTSPEPTNTRAAPSSITHTNSPPIPPSLSNSMSQEQETGRLSPQSSHLSLPDSLPSTSQKKHRQLRFPTFQKKSKSSLQSIPQGPPSPPSPVPSSPSEKLESLSSSSLTERPVMTTTDPTPPPPQNTVPGSKRTTLLYTMTDSLDTAPGHPPSVMTPLALTLPHSPEVSPPLPTYDELLQQIAKLQQQKSSHNSSHATTRSSGPSCATEPLPSSTSVQVTHDWRVRQPLNTGSDKLPVTLMSLDFHGNGNTNSGTRLGN
ncbi:hypothetical protein EV421DRAFT_1913388 [Armillaria borealis]|uniref:Uncharacterized protein n=1 Tax=Armillaria borealis TaxID=47425 RepID=A0AA39ITA5_9AGAR|nr:hypothetical protein EV421DRAFT_1913388 [Armillaria borealis]